ncbi:ComEA family DNA-binding protein [Shewanella sp. YIC-542]|uniref:ComEA family DNA-binding protein n=1 Tax=Shewanella mytili TaxID=3377111 RepID=UPI00398E9637
MKHYLKAMAMAAALLLPAWSTLAVAEPAKTDMGMQQMHMQKININTATAAELQMLNGIGEAKAQAIVEYREANGKFTSLEELTKVKGIGPKLLEKNAGMLSL